MIIMTRVLVIPSWYPTKEDPISGIFFFEQIRALKDAGIEIGVIFPELISLSKLSLKRIRNYHFQTKESIESNIPTIRFFGWRFPKWEKLQILIMTLIGKKLFKIYVKKHGLPEIIHAHSTTWAGFVAMKISISKKIPYIVTEHRGAFFLKEQNPKLKFKPWYFPRIHRILQQASQVISVSNSLAQAIKKNFDLNELKIDIIPNLIERSLFQKPEIPRTQTPFKYLLIGNFVREKNFEMAIRAFDKVYSKNNECELYIVGQGPLERELKSLIENLASKNVIKFMGRLDRNDVAKLFQILNVLIVSSLWETFGVVMIEALATGMPVISTNCGGPSDIISLNSVGMLCSIGDVDELAQKMIEIKNNYSNYKPEEIVDYFNLNYSESVITSKIKKIYDSIVAKFYE